MYNIGDKVWIVDNSLKTVTYPCPDCLGKRYLTVIMGDNSTVSIDCGQCYVASDWSGYSRGYLERSERSWDVKEAIVNEIRLENGSMVYRTDPYNGYNEPIFSDKIEAMKHALHKKDIDDNREASRLYTKEKPHKTWQHNVSYHRGVLRRNNKDNEYHTAKLNVALELAKKHTKKEV